MQPRATFELVRTDDPEVFAVRITGHLGTRERAAVESFVGKCRQNGKRKVAFDFSGLESLGGSVAKVLGDFATEMAAEGHPPWFIGASSVVQSFLTARFGATTPCFADDLQGAQLELSRPITPVRTEDLGSPAAPAREAEDDDGTVTLDAAELLGDPAGASRPTTPIADDSMDAGWIHLPPAGPEPGVTRRHSYLTLSDAVPLLVEVGSLRDAKPILEGLLHGADLADSCELFCVDGDRLVEVVAGMQRRSRSLPANGSVCAVLRRRGAPVDLVDLTEMRLAEPESEVLTSLNCTVAVPVFLDDELDGIFFCRKTKAGVDYVSSEELALDLLARQIGLSLGTARARARQTAPEEEQKLRGQLRRQRTLLRLCRELHAIGEEDRLLSRLLISIIGEMGVAGAVYFALQDDRLTALHVYGIESGELRPLTIASPARVRSLEEFVRVECAEAEIWGDALEGLRRLGIDALLPLRGKQDLLGILGLATRRARDTGSFDPEYVQALVDQAGIAVEHARGLHLLDEQMLRVAKTLITLIERRIGQGHLASTELVTHLTAHVAEHLDYDREHRRGLLYGAVLRDVGMIEISDVVLKSPRSLTPEEWRLLKRHPITGADLLRTMQFSDVTCDVVLHHHERFNGEGYPHGLRGTAIPLGARIVSVVESYAAMIRDTPYRPALSPDEALAVLEENWEMRYDPVVVETFARIVRREGTPRPQESVESLLVG